MGYVNSAMRTRRRTDLEAVECIALEINLPYTNFLLLSCYKQPDHSPELFFSALSRILSKATEYSMLLVHGDFYATSGHWDTTTNSAGRRAASFFFLFDDFPLTQCVSEPTRFSAEGSSRSVLDLFAINLPDLVLSVQVSDPISDHCCVTVQVALI